ncbi:uncharacterized protein LOC121506665 [Cheilinus undulatus]|uniref:uncharacterized protein LOC121506665 n=1 Tax=Cheilinus undulatus TaxID=241271 RepID=UPI001BD2EA7D|nr:uncharacterized protein LOC121506665 [Cheilinus undulatus]
MPHALQELGLFFLFLSFSPSLSDPVYMAIGGDAVLRPPHLDLPIQKIKWKHNENTAAEWQSGDKYQCLGQFEGRCEVNNDTGALTIKELNLNDSGIYTPEINGRVFNKIQLSVISRVAKPSVKTSCKTEMAFCLLTCEGNTADIELIIFKWFVDGRDGPSGYLFIITKDTKGDSFRCMMKNPVSNETSESVINPYIKQIYGAKGEDVILRPPPMTDTIRRIEWKHNENIAAGWYGDEFECLGQFEGRCEVNTDSGALTIKELNLNDNGIYTPEINGKNSSKTHLSIISHVAKPSVETFCNTERTSCDLKCEGNTAEAEPITYTWFIDGRDGSSDKVLTIKKDTKEYSFRCLMMNPVSNETSESIKNPVIMKQEQDRLISILVPAVIVVVVVIVVAAFFICKHIRKRRQRAKLEKIMLKLEDMSKRLTELRDTAAVEEDMLKQLQELGESTTDVYDMLKGLQEPGDTDTVEEGMLKLATEIGDTVKQLRELFAGRCKREACEGMQRENNVKPRHDRKEMLKQLQELGDKSTRLTELGVKHFGERKGTEEEMRPLNQPPDGEGQTDTTQHLSNGAETESVTPETSNQSPAAAASNINQETELTSVVVPDLQTSGPPDTNKDSKKMQKELDVKRRHELQGTEEEMRPLNQPPDGEDELPEVYDEYV